MNTHVVVTGARGMLGQDITRAFENRGARVTGLSKKELDITRETTCRQVLKDLRPNIVVNCAAFTKVDLCERERDLAYRVNALGPQNLSGICREIGAWLVHISTDYVFDGTATRPYLEDEKTNPVNVYGQSKLAGEKAVARAGGRYLIVRTSWLFGAGGPNFIATMLNLSENIDTLNVVNDQRGRPTFTMDLSKGILLLLDSGASGIVHCANSGSCTWFELCCYALKRAGKTGIEVIPVSSNRFERPAKRPAYSVLSIERFKTITSTTPRHWTEAVDSLLCENSPTTQETRFRTIG